MFFLEGDGLVGAEVDTETAAIAGIGDAEFFGIAGFIVSRVDAFSEQCGQGAFAAVVVAVGMMEDFLLDDNEAGGGAAEDLLLFFDIGDGKERDVIIGHFYREFCVEGYSFGGEGVFEKSSGLAGGAAAGEHEVDVRVMRQEEFDAVDEFSDDVGDTEEIDGEDEADVLFVLGVESVMGVVVGLGDGDDCFVFRTEFFDSEEGIAGGGEVEYHIDLLVLLGGRSGLWWSGHIVIFGYFAGGGKMLGAVRDWGNAVVDTRDCNTSCGKMREGAAASPIRRFLFISADRGLFANYVYKYTQAC